MAKRKIHNPEDGASYYSLWKGLIIADPIPGSDNYCVQVNNKINRKVRIMNQSASSPKQAILKALIPRY